MNPKGEGVDVMYRNIRHAFFQPAENEVVTILHFHLHDAIMMGNKKTRDVQFYAEVRRRCCGAWVGLGWLGALGLAWVGLGGGGLCVGRCLACRVCLRVPWRRCGYALHSSCR